ncbi:MAG: hypothetical protein WAP03_06625 [Methylorubrum rhodinum]|uniref:hypothetical protein n=1 Tax=Methylorubrum rhodinum TaxID=29428 RepID=UPI003BB21508
MQFRVAAVIVVLGMLAAGPAGAQSAASRIDQPTPGTLPPDTSTVPNDPSGKKDGNGRVAPPSAIQSSTDVMKSDGSVQGNSSSGRTDPVEHLPKDMR